MEPDKKLVWSDSDYKKWLKCNAKSLEEFAVEIIDGTVLPTLTPLKEVMVESGMGILVEEEVDYDGCLKKFRVTFPLRSSKLVTVRFFQLARGLVGDNETFEFDLNKNFKKGVKVKVEIKNFSQFNQKVYLRFFAKEEKQS